jgi:hypothetical protein
MLLTVCSVAERSKDDATQKFVMMEGATRNGVYTVLKGVYTRSLDESRVYEKEVENIQKTNIKERRRGRDSTLLLLLGHGRDESRTCRTKERRISQMRVAKAAAAMLGRIILEKKTPKKCWCMVRNPQQLNLKW